MNGLDTYTVRARLAPAILAAAPALALGVALLPALPGAQKLWSLVALGLTTYSALVARAEGNRVQPLLFEEWGGTPTIARLRFTGADSTEEIAQRHLEIERAAGHTMRLPDETQEAADGGSADANYQAAMDRVKARVRSAGTHRLVEVENRNYGFARNLYGLKRFGLLVALITLCSTIILGLIDTLRDAGAHSAPLLLPLGVSVAALVLWRRVTPQFVRPNAEAYADRLIEAARDLPHTESN